jgi:hypothetical protein
MAGNTSANNGRLGGRPLGRKNDKTLMLEEEHKAFQQIVLEQLRPLIQSQLLIAKGTAHVYRIDIGPRGGRSDPALVTNPDELFDAIRAIDAGAGHGDIAEEGGGEDGTDITHRYYFITTKPPDGKVVRTRDGMKRVRECVYGGELDLQTLVWTRGRDFPLARLESCLKCPACGSRQVRLAFSVPPSNQQMRASS